MPDQTLDEGELARRSSSSPERIRHLVEIGLLRADGEGRFALADTQRVQIVAAYERGGIRLEELANAVREGRITFDYIDRIYPEASPPSGRTLGDLVAEIGHGELVGELFTA